MRDWHFCCKCGNVFCGHLCSAWRGREWWLDRSYSTTNTWLFWQRNVYRSDLTAEVHPVNHHRHCSRLLARHTALWICVALTSTQSTNLLHKGMWDTMMPCLLLTDTGTLAGGWTDRCPLLSSLQVPTISMKHLHQFSTETCQIFMHSKLFEFWTYYVQVVTLFIKDTAHSDSFAWSHTNLLIVPYSLPTAVTFKMKLKNKRKRKKMVVM